MPDVLKAHCNSIQALIDLHKDLLRVTSPLALSTSSNPSSTPSSSARRQAELSYTDDISEAQLVDQVLKLTRDENAEVKNNAVSWYV